MIQRRLPIPPQIRRHLLLTLGRPLRRAPRPKPDRMMQLGRQRILIAPIRRHVGLALGRVGLALVAKHLRADRHARAHARRRAAAYAGGGTDAAGLAVVDLRAVEGARAVVGCEGRVGRGLPMRPLRAVDGGVGVAGGGGGLVRGLARGYGAGADGVDGAGPGGAGGDGSHGGASPRDGGCGSWQHGHGDG